MVKVNRAKLTDTWEGEKISQTHHDQNEEKKIMGGVYITPSIALVSLLTSNV